MQTNLVNAGKPNIIHVYSIYSTVSDSLCYQRISPFNLHIKNKCAYHKPTVIINWLGLLLLGEKKQNKTIFWVDRQGRACPVVCTHFSPPEMDIASYIHSFNNLLK